MNLKNLSLGESLVVAEDDLDILIKKYLKLRNYEIVEIPSEWRRNGYPLDFETKNSKKIKIGKNKFEYIEGDIWGLTFYYVDYTGPDAADDSDNLFVADKRVIKEIRQVYPELKL